MQRSLESRLTALEALEAQEAQQPAIARVYVPPPPPSFDAVLADLDLVLAALGDGRAHVGRLMSTWRNGTEIPGYGLWGMPDPIVCAAGIRVSGLMRDYGATDLKTAAEHIAWIAEHRWAVAFYSSRTDAELDHLAGMDGDPLFWTPEQHALGAEWARLVEGE